MPQKKPQTIAIVGAGTIGLYLAWKLSQFGHKVTVFEKNQKIEKKTCSGLISERLKNFIPINNSFVKHQIDSCLIYFPKKTISLDFKLKFLVVDRQKLNEKLVELAKKSGAEIIFGNPIKEIPGDFDKIIGCDGALSKVREILGLPSPNFRLGLQTFLPIKNSSSCAETWPIQNGFCWKIPRGSQTEYGALGSLDSIWKDFEKFCQDQNINFDEKEIKSALVPYGLILPEDEKATLCGDAAGLAKPWSGGGVIWGLSAANILIKNFPDFEKYHRETKLFFRSKIFWGKFSNALAYFSGKNLSLFLPKKISIDNDFLLG